MSAAGDALAPASYVPVTASVTSGGSNSAVVFGHYPPPVTGERLCTLHLIRSLEDLGYPTAARQKKDGFGRKSGSAIWLILGSRFGGFLRDCLIGRIQAFGEAPVLVYIHNASWKRIAKLGRAAHAIFGSKARFVVLTEAIASALRATGVSACVLRNTVTATELQGLRIEQPAKRLLWVSAVTAEKGFLLAYEACLARRTQDPEWVFDVYGKGLEGTQFPQARFHGVVQGDEKRDAFAAGGIFVLPSRYKNETQPLCLLEAMSIGMPVVSTAIGGIAEIIGAGQDASGVCLPADATAKDLSVAIEQVCVRYRQFGGSGLARFERLFSHTAFAEGLAAIMRETGVTKEEVLQSTPAGS